MSECAHKLLKKQVVGEFVYYVCECGQKGLVEPWDGKVSVLAPPDPRKDLAALEELAKEIEMHCPCGARPESLNTHAHVPGCKVEALVQRLAEMRGAGR